MCRRIRRTLMQTCQFFALSVICFANASSPKGRAEKSVRTFCPYAQSKLVSPSGRDVAQRQRGLAPSLRELDLPQAKTEGAASYLSRIRQTLARTRQRAAPSVTACAVPPSSGRKAFFVFRTKQKRAQICTLFFGGRWWIRTTEVVDNRFTVCPLWPLGKPPIFTCRNRGAGGRT